MPDVSRFLRSLVIVALPVAVVLFRYESNRRRGGMSEIEAMRDALLAGATMAGLLLVMAIVSVIE